MSFSTFFHHREALGEHLDGKESEEDQSKSYKQKEESRLVRTGELPGRDCPVGLGLCSSCGVPLVGCNAKPRSSLLFPTCPLPAPFPLSFPQATFADFKTISLPNSSTSSSAAQVEPFDFPSAPFVSF